ncbi:MAG: sulfite exporter TauE/SafE family protein [Proteobacteria bacterium]|nr:sulfite exporter TauE/SafE family protein [Pseudomonadota bacterium]
MLTINLIDTGLFILTGSCAGFAAGLLGVGGGLIIVPVLYLVFTHQGYDPAYLMHMALTTSLATIVFTSISSTRAHHRRQAVIWPLVFLLSPGIIVGAWFGGLFASQIDSRYLINTFAIFEFLVALNLILKKQTAQHAKTISPVAATFGGFSIGFVSTIVGIGGGTMTVPFLHWFNISIRKAVATSAACGFPIALVGALSYIYASYGLNMGHSTVTTSATIGYLHLDALLFIAISSFISAPLGARVAHAISEKTLRLSFAILLFGLSFIMFLNN